jgi:hypothetical protein
MAFSLPLYEEGSLSTHCGIHHERQPFDIVTETTMSIMIHGPPNPSSVETFFVLPAGFVEPCVLVPIHIRLLIWLAMRAVTFCMCCCLIISMSCHINRFSIFMRTFPHQHTQLACFDSLIVSFQDRPCC